MAVVIAVHGLGGEPAALGALPDALRRHGHHVVTPLLAGHGLTPDDLVGVTGADWVADVDRAIDESPEPVWLVGQSLGGTLALVCAAVRADVRGVVAINPPCGPRDDDVFDHLDWLIERGRTMQALTPPRFASAEARDVGYDRVPISALRALAELSVKAFDALERVRIPVLLVTSALDDVVDPAQADVIHARLSTSTRLVLPASGHVALLDAEADLVTAAVSQFVFD